MVSLGAVGSSLLLTGGTMLGLLITLASATGGAGFRLPHGAAPTSPTNGDIWTTMAGLFARINAATLQMASLAGAETLSNKTLLNAALSGSVTENSYTSQMVPHLRLIARMAPTKRSLWEPIAHRRRLILPTVNR